MKHLSSVVFLLLNFRLHTFAIPVDSGIRDGDMELAKKYLNDFYSPDPSALLLSDVNDDDSMTEKLKEMQRFFRLKVTGNVDAETLQVMGMPRCGFSDVAKENRKWPKNHLTYRIWNYPSNLGSSSVDQAIQKAFQVWSNVTPLTFQRLPRDSDADITIYFAYGDHNDGHPFDGPKGVLAHAFLPGPRIGGDAHFDAAERWTVQGRRDINLFLVAAHEIGHSLGLNHHNIPRALMYPHYHYVEPSKFKLHPSEIQAIQTLYGPELIQFDLNSKRVAGIHQKHNSFLNTSELSLL